ncbi:MAG: DUF72 domain-containing protein [Thermoplasmatales archaeon]|nr:DUF72 domain-containing protein [Thermoplasmatales archaeon]MCW6169674.1 DUF72 domain-containing protein [Thermoplasmatales archaeon]
MIYLGCSGWNYEDWRGSFYPRGTVDQLKYYSKVFDTVEVNSTFYRDFKPETLKSWISRVRENPRFKFTLKLPQKISHEDIFNSTQAAISDLSDFLESEVSIFQEMNAMGVVLFQIPPHFTKGLESILIDILSHVDTYKTKFFVEFRNKALYNDMQVRNKLNQINVGVVRIDSPDILVNDFREDNFGDVYFRFHGRNKADWFSPVQLGQGKYNYRYTKEELSDLSLTVKESIGFKDEIFIYFNNHPNGSAPVNALEMSEMLNLSTGITGRRLEV